MKIVSRLALQQEVTEAVSVATTVSKTQLNYHWCSSVAERMTFNHVVRGSIPLISKGFYLFLKKIVVRLAQSVEHRSYEPKVGSSILPANNWSSLWSIASYLDTVC